MEKEIKKLNVNNDESLEKQVSAAIAKTEKILEVNGVHKAFSTQGAGSINVLTDISFDIVRGSFNIIFGPSGSGKTTILNTILGLEKPDKGTVKFYGNELFEMDSDELTEFRSHHFGVVYQSSNWVHSLNVMENVSLPLLFMGIEEKLAHERAMENLKIVGMENFAKRDPKTLSGGQQQRVSLARSLVNNPWVIVADEPTGNLDTKAGTDVMQLLYDLTKKYKRTVILVTHNLDYVILATQMIYIRDGKISTREEALPKPISVKM